MGQWTIQNDTKLPDWLLDDEDGYAWLQNNEMAKEEMYVDMQSMRNFDLDPYTCWMKISYGEHW